MKSRVVAVKVGPWWTRVPIRSLASKHVDMTLFEQMAHWSVTSSISLQSPNLNTLRRYLQRYFPEIVVRVLNQHLKRLGIEYDKNGMTNSTRKVYKGIRKYTQSELLEMEGGENPE